jgi:hypothetical protein
MIFCERDNVFRLRMFGSFVMYLLIMKAISFVGVADGW